MEKYLTADKEDIISECFLNVDKTNLKLGHYMAIGFAMEEYSSQKYKRILELENKLSIAVDCLNSIYNEEDCITRHMRLIRETLNKINK